MEYDILWGDGPLGLTLRPDLGEDMPPVVGRITRNDSAAARGNVAVGHMLVSINGSGTASQGYDQIVNLLQRIPRPATLRFRVPHERYPRPNSIRVSSNSTHSEWATSSGGRFGTNRPSTRSTGSVDAADPERRFIRPSGPTSERRSRPNTFSDSQNGSFSTRSINDNRDSGYSSGDRSSQPSSTRALSENQNLRPGLNRIDTGSSGRSSKQYSIVWTEGPLGMILKPDNDDVHVPCIRRITGRGAGTGMERASVGDVLVAVNGQETKLLGFRSTIALLKTIRKPAVLKFRSMGRVQRAIHEPADHQEAAPSPQMSQDAPSVIHADFQKNSLRGTTPVYEIVWREGDLGLKLKPGRNDVPMLSKLTGKGNASGLQNARIGDELVSVNGIFVEGQAYKETLHMLKHAPKPAVLQFRPKERKKMAPTDINGGYMATDPYVPTYAKSQEEVGGSNSSERPRRKKRIPLEVAKELVAASLGADKEVAIFNGIPIASIQDGTREAHDLRVEAKICILSKAKEKGNLSKVHARDAILKAAKKRKILEGVLARIKDQAKHYENILAEQERARLLAPAIRNKSKDIVGKQDDLIKELTGAISGLKRDYDSNDESTGPVIVEDAEQIAFRQGMLESLQKISTIAVVVPNAQYCAECGTSSTESKLEKDDYGEYYCKDCWDAFLNAEQVGDSSWVASAATSLPDRDVVTETKEEVKPLIPVISTAEKSTTSASLPISFLPTVLDNKYSEDAELKAIKEAEEKIAQLKLQRDSVATLIPPVEKQTIPNSTIGNNTSDDAELNAIKEAEEQIAQLKLLCGSEVSLLPPVENQTPTTSGASAADRSRRNLSGLVELTEALKSEAEHARVTGNVALAKRLEAQIARKEAESKCAIPDVGSSPAPPRDIQQSLVDTSSQPQVETVLKEAVEAHDPSPTKGENSSCLANIKMELVDETNRSASTVSSHSPSNDYDDENSEDGEDDDAFPNDYDDDVRAAEDQNYALEQGVKNAYDVINNARMSLFPTIDDSDGLQTIAGLSKDQISLLEKLTNNPDERATMVDSLHPDDSDSDSDSNSGQSDGERDGEEDEDEEDEDGVWI